MAANPRSSLIVSLAFLALVVAGGLLYYGISRPGTGSPQQPAGGAATEAPRPTELTASGVAPAVADGTTATERREAVAQQDRGADRVVVRGRLVFRGGAPATAVTAVLRGKVTTLGGVPVAPDREAPAEPLAKVETDAQGAFALVAPSGTRTWLAVLGKSVVIEGGAKQVDVPKTDVDLGDIQVLRAAKISGRVLSGGAPAGGIEVARGSGSSLALFGSRRGVTTDAEGRFELDGLTPGAVTLTTRSPKHLPASQKVELVEGQQVNDLVITLEAGGFVTGQVLDDQGRPVAGARVTAARVGTLGPGFRVQGFNPGESTTSDEDGNFQLGGLTDTATTLRATKEGFARAENTGVSAGQRVALRLQRLGSVTGVLVDERGAPIAGSSVSAFRSKGQRPMFERGAVTTDAEGRFTLKGVTPGKNEVVASGAGHLDARTDVDVRPAETTTIDKLQARSGATLTVTVRDDSGNPVAGAEVQVFHVGRPDYAFHGALPSGAVRREVRRTQRNGADDVVVFGGSRANGTAKTDATGVAVVRGLAAGSAEVRGTHQSLAIERPVALEIPEGAALTAKLRMVRGGTAHFVVVDAENKPVGGSQLNVIGPITGAVDQAPQHPQRTDGAGEVTVGPLLPGAYQAVLEKPRTRDLGGVAFVTDGDQQRLEDSRVEFTVKAEQTSEVKLRMPVLTRVTGTVSDRTGPVKGAEVELIADGEIRMPMLGGRKARTDADGRFHIDGVPSGTYRMHFGRANAAVQDVKDLVLAKDLAVHEEHLMLPGGVIELTAVDAAKGYGVEEAKVSLRRYREPGARASARPQRVAMIMVQRNDSPGGATGESTLEYSSGGAATVSTDGQGRAVLRDVPAGKFTLTIEHAEYSKFTQTVEILKDQTKQLGKVVLQVGCSIRGRVKFPAGTTGAMAIARVEATLEGGGRPETKVTQNGSFRFDGLKPGKYTVRAISVLNEAESETKTVLVSADQPARVELELAKR
ncbi:MAG: carboxypeptidase regulatory-like domain-containing protein [Planctomycetes bacterium]|nr:carboxypeptidase regulatory-like domain-containing protein [Planctomycetota bacterium]